MTTYQTTESRQLWLNSTGTLIYSAPIPPAQPYPTECAAPPDEELEADGWMKVAEYKGDAELIGMPIMSKEIDDVDNDWDFLDKTRAMQASHMPIDPNLWDNSSLD